MKFKDFILKKKKKISLNNVERRISIKKMFSTVISDYDAKCKYECRKDSDTKLLNHSISNISNTMFCSCVFENKMLFPMIDR